jgi:RNA polymerase sigma-70 factor (ECF subfamily)
MDGRSDVELLGEWQAGDLTAGQALFERHFNSLHRFFRNKVEHGLEDLIQQTLLACVEGRARFRGDSSFRSYLLQTARYQLYAYYRSRMRRQAVDFSVTSVIDLGDTPSRVLVRQEDVRCLLEALRRIPLDAQIVVELYFWEDLTGPEIAAVLAIPEPTVRSRLRRALERLRAELEGLVGGGAAQLFESEEDFERWAQRLRQLVHGTSAEG